MKILRLTIVVINFIELTDWLIVTTNVVMERY